MTANTHEPNNTAQLTVYSTTKCVQCDATYRALDKRGILYNVVNVEHNPDAAQKLKDLGYMKAPVVVHGTDHWTGFRPDKIENIPTPDKAHTVLPIHH